MEYRSWFQCAEGCDETHELTEVVYRCSTCGGLLEVRHDVEALRDRSPASWMKLFDERYKRSAWPYGSAVWGKKEWVCPQIADENIVSIYEGGTNLFWAERLGRQLDLPDLWVKQCGNDHTGSFKDLGMTVLVSMVKEMRSRGTEIRAVACASTGDTSAALAAYCASAGIPAIVFLPRDKVSPAQLVQPMANGALVLSLDTDFDGCMRIVKEVTVDGSIYLANSMNSLRVEGQKTIGIEIVQQFDWEVPDWIVIPGGNLGNVSALGKGLLLMRDLGLISALPRICCAQAERANPLYRSFRTGFEEFEPITAGATAASAIRIGDPVSVRKAIRILRQFPGSVVEQASEDELANAAALGDRAGLFSCPHTGVGLAAMIKLRERGEIQSGQRVVVISTAHGLKFAEFKNRYHAGELPDVESRHRNQPVELPASSDAVLAELERRVQG